MKFIILCGGTGKRCNNYSLPKPLNLINGRHMIEYVINNIPSNEVFIIYNIFLNEYSFQETITNKCKSKKIHFACVDYNTRGAVETAFVGIQSFVEKLDNDNIVFIDNDNLHSFDKNMPIFQNNFVGYSVDFLKTNYSFIRFSNNIITCIEEKNKISDFYCCGFYGFKNTAYFQKYAKTLLYQNFKQKNEFYFSELYNLVIQNGDIIEPFYIEKTNHIGTIDEIISNNSLISKPKLRICFDLDNTLFTYPVVVGDYSTVKPINKNIKLLNKLKKDGHEIIIYTARRMQTHNGNIGKVIKDIASITITTLETYNIQYDELIFGKPIADIYIDDRAINPYINDVSYFGLFYNVEKFIPNKIKNNKYNNIIKSDEYVVKTGPYDLLKGELFYYQNIPDELQEYFPRMFDYTKNINSIDLKIDYIEGIPLYYLYKNTLLTQNHIDELFDILEIIHNNKIKINITKDNVKNNYISKLEARFKNKDDYYFEDANDVYLEITQGIENNFSPILTSVIHGDFWFSNIILTYQDKYKFIDMKGIVDDIFTLNGDIYYDFGKFYQSILGYDLLLNNDHVNIEYVQTMKQYFLKKCETKGLNINYLTYVTKGLIFGTFRFISHYDCTVKKNIWKLIKSDLMNKTTF